MYYILLVSNSDSRFTKYSGIQTVSRCDKFPISTTRKSCTAKKAISEYKQQLSKPNFYSFFGDETERNDFGFFMCQKT